MTDDEIRALHVRLDVAYIIDKLELYLAMLSISFEGEVVQSSECFFLCAVCQLLPDGVWAQVLDQSVYIIRSGRFNTIPRLDVIAKQLDGYTAFADILSSCQLQAQLVSKEDILDRC